VHEELTSRSQLHVSDCIIRLESIDQEILDGHIYEVAFDGTDADAELLEKTTGLAILGDAMEDYSDDQICLLTGKPTRRKQHLARMY